MLLKYIATALCITAAGMAQAQTLEQRLRAGAAMSADLTLPTEAQELSPSSPLNMAIYKPSGHGPFAALVIHHSCGGLRTEIQDWVAATVKRGYVAFVLDSNMPRGLGTNCSLPTTVPVSRGVKDAFQALNHIKSLPFVDPARVGFIGFSWGGMVGLLASSAEISKALSDGARFTAAVSVYPMCNFAGTAKYPTPFEYLRPDTDKPLLVLMGGEDTETPASECLPRIKALQDRGAALESHLYSTATHCWDCSSINGLRKTDFQGNAVVYRFDKLTTDDSMQRTFEFMGKYLGAGQLPN